ncbi:uncharacterized protein IAS62_005458 [Cryptococcus decagattii]|uniref:Uncharacterized protein n=1 Tax=Cryptococcus decagattii TaxID=1859122 RepID=A0ABZ2B103_9TREE
MLSSPRHFLNTFHTPSQRSTNASQASFTSYAASHTTQDTHRTNSISNPNPKPHSQSRSPYVPASTSMAMAADRDFAPSIYRSTQLGSDKGGGGSVLQGSVTSHMSKSSLFRNPFKKNNDLLSQLERAERAEKDRERQKEKVKLKEYEKEKENEREMREPLRRSGVMKQGTAMIRRRLSITRSDVRAVVTPTPKARENGIYGDGDEYEEVMITVGNHDEMHDFHSPTQRPLSPIVTRGFLKTPTKEITSLSASHKKSKASSRPPSSSISPPMLRQRKPEDPINLNIFDSSTSFPNYDTDLDVDAIDTFVADAIPKKIVKSITRQVKMRPKSIYVKRLNKRFGKADDTEVSPKHSNCEIPPALQLPLRVKSLSAEYSLRTASASAHEASRHIPTKEELMNMALPPHTPQGLPSRYRPNGTTIFDIYPDEDLDYHPIPPPRIPRITHLGPNVILNSTTSLHLHDFMTDINTNTNLSFSPNTDTDTRQRTMGPRSSRVFDIPNGLYDLWQYGMDEPEIMDISLNEEASARKRILPMFVRIRSTGRRLIENARLQSPDPDARNQGHKMGKDELARSSNRMLNDLTDGPIAMGSNPFRMEISPASLDSGSESSCNSQHSEVSDESQMSEGTRALGELVGLQGSRENGIGLLVYGKVETASKMSLKYATPRAAGRALAGDMRADGMANNASAMTSSISQASQISGIWDYAALIDDHDHASSQAVHTCSDAQAQSQGRPGKGEKGHPGGGADRDVAFTDAESIPDMELGRDSVFEHAL